jgi:hypothetical protein
MKTRKYPVNHDCPLSNKEKKELGKVLDNLEWQFYAPLKHLTSSYADATVTDYDELEIKVKIECGSDGSGNHYKEYATIKRSDFSVEVETDE